jgi:hypothetical protein
VHVAGRSEGRSAVLKARIMFDAGRHYWINGTPTAAVARMISAGRAFNPVSDSGPRRWTRCRLSCKISFF